MVSGQQHVPAALYPRERPGTHFTGGWGCPRAGLDRRKNSSPPEFDPGPTARSRYTDWATLPTRNRHSSYNNCNGYVKHGNECNWNVGFELCWIYCVLTTKTEEKHRTPEKKMEGPISLGELRDRHYVWPISVHDYDITNFVLQSV